MFALPVSDLEHAATTASVEVMLTGAFARDLHIVYAHGIAIGRMTQDLDFGVAVGSWSDFETLRVDLIGSGRFSPSAHAPHRFIHVATKLPVDVVPFAGVEDESRHIAWPPRGETRMDAFGLREAFGSSERVRLPGGVLSRVVSLPALAMLKLVTWVDRHLSAPRKDAYDIMLIASNYMECRGHERLFVEFEPWTRAPDFDYELCGARMLGHDIRSLLDATGHVRVAAILSEQTATHLPGSLPREMNAQHPDRARNLLGAMLKGLTQP